jgi:hypothetical protein
VSVAINGRAEEIPGLDTRSFLDPGGPPHCARFYAAGSRHVRHTSQVVVHTVHGKRGGAVAVDAAGAPLVCAVETIDRYARYYAKKASRQASCQLWIGGTGLTLCTVDLASERAWHAGAVNPYSIGIELEQRLDGTLYAATLDALAVLVPWLCDRFDVPRRVPMRAGRPIVGVVKRYAAWAGVIGHRNLTTNRGPGDPTDTPMLRLFALGFEGADPDA